MTLVLVGAGVACGSESRDGPSADGRNGAGGAPSTGTGASFSANGTGSGAPTAGLGATAGTGGTPPSGGGASGGTPPSTRGGTPSGGSSNGGTEPIGGASTDGGTLPAGGTATPGGSYPTGGASDGGGAGGSGAGGGAGAGGSPATTEYPATRTRVLLNDGWRFTKNDPSGTSSSALSYSNVRQWVLPTGNRFLSNTAARYERPQGNLGESVTYAGADFDDSSWQAVTLPHDYAILGPFTDSVSANMGHLPATGIAWYRKTFTLPAEDAGKSVFVDFDGAMSYSMVWVNGQFVGGWPYGYASYRLDVTAYVNASEENLIAVRLDNPVPSGTDWDQGSSRWYPGAGIYRDVWLVTTHPVHVAQWGTYVRTPEVSESSASVQLDVTVDNDSADDVSVSVATDLYEVDAEGRRVGEAVASMAAVELAVSKQASATAETSGTLAQPKLWGVRPTGVPNLYDAVTTVTRDGTVVDTYETRFGVRTLKYDPDQGLLVNGAHVEIQGVCNHHDLGALGAVANVRGKQRQLEILGEMGANAIRTAHNPETPAFYDLADQMGFLVMDDAFDVWSQQKTALDYHLLFADWHEQDLRAMIRRDRNHPSVFLWNIGNEIPEQSDSGIGATVKAINDTVHAEDPTRPTVSGMNAANPGSAFANAVDTVGLNYQGSGVRGAAPEYPDFHEAYPDKFIVGTETASTVSSRGIYTFPVVSGRGEPASKGGGLTQDGQVSSYDLYFADYSYSPDLEFESQDRWAYVSGEFVWTGFDYLGEPDPSSGRGARSSFYGIIDLAGFPKDRFYLYQATWRPDLPVAHLLPHWTWPERVGEVTPVHVYTSGDEAELFVNGESHGRKEKGQYEYRLRWDDVVYEPGELRVVAYKNGQEWATETVETAGDAAGLELSPDRATIRADGRDLSFIRLTVVDPEGRRVPGASNLVRFSVSGPGVLVATDNGNPLDKSVFSSPERHAFSGLGLAIVCAQPNQSGAITVTATSEGLTQAETVLTSQ